MFSMKSKLQEIAIQCLESYLLEYLEKRNTTNFRTIENQDLAIKTNNKNILIFIFDIANGKVFLLRLQSQVSSGGKLRLQS